MARPGSGRRRRPPAWCPPPGDHGGEAGLAEQRGGPGAAPKTGTVFVSAGSVATVDLQAVPGRLTIVGATTGRVTLSGAPRTVTARIVSGALELLSR